MCGTKIHNITTIKIRGSFVYHDRPISWAKVSLNATRWNNLLCRNLSILSLHLTLYHFSSFPSVSSQFKIRLFHRLSSLLIMYPVHSHFSLSYVLNKTKKFVETSNCEENHAIFLIYSITKSSKAKY